MARTAVTPLVATPNGGSSANPAGTTIDATLVTNGVKIDDAYQMEEIVLRVTATASSGKNLTIQSGADPAAEMAIYGDLTVAFAAGNVTPQVKYVGPFTSARFVQGDGDLWVDFESGFTGTIEAIHLPRTA